MKPRLGWAVALPHAHGGETLALGGSGVTPTVWLTAEKAAEMRDELAARGLHGRVVRVQWWVPVICAEPQRRQHR